MCVGPIIGASTPQPKPAAQQLSEGIAKASPDAWRSLATNGGMIGAVAQQKLIERSAPSLTFPAIPKSK